MKPFHFVLAAYLGSALALQAEFELAKESPPGIVHLIETENRQAIDHFVNATQIISVRVRPQEDTRARTAEIHITTSKSVYEITFPNRKAANAAALNIVGEIARKEPAPALPTVPPLVRTSILPQHAPQQAPKEAPEEASEEAPQQARQISGSVLLGPGSLPMAGARIAIPSLGLATTSDEEGKFSLQLPFRIIAPKGANLKLTVTAKGQITELPIKAFHLKGQPLDVHLELPN